MQRHGPSFLQQSLLSCDDNKVLSISAPPAKPNSVFNVEEFDIAKIPGHHPTNGWELGLIPLAGKQEKDLHIGVVLRVDEEMRPIFVRKILRKHFKNAYLERESSVHKRQYEYLFDWRAYESVQGYIEQNKTLSKNILKLSQIHLKLLNRQDDPRYFRTFTDAELADRWSKMPPDLTKDLKPFQKEGIEFLWKHNGKGMISDEMGLGKTIQAISFMISLEKCDDRGRQPILVISPKSSAGNWRQELLKRNPELKDDDICTIKSGKMAKEFLPAMVKHSENGSTLQHSNISSGPPRKKRKCIKELSISSDDEPQVVSIAVPTTVVQKSPKKRKSRKNLTVEEALKQLSTSMSTSASSASGTKKRKRRKTPQEKLDEQNKVYPVYFVTYGLVKPILSLLKKCRFQSMILDESQAIKNFETLQAQACYKLCKSKDCKNLVLLSGTPGTRPFEMYSQLRMIHPWMFKTFWIPYLSPAESIQKSNKYFRSDARKHIPNKYETDGFNYAWRYCDPDPYTRKGFGRSRKIDFKFKSVSRVLEIGAVLQKYVFIRRTKKEVQTQLPPINRVITYLEADETSMEKHQEAVDKLATYKKIDEKLWESKLMDLYNDKVPAIKLPLIREYLRDTFTVGRMAANPDAKCIMFAYHKSVLSEIKECLDELHIPCFMMHGETEGSERTRNIERFRTEPVEKCRVAILSFAFAEAINMEVAEEVNVFQLVWQPEKLLQAEARCHRLTSKKMVTANYVLLKGSMEETLMWPRIQDKQNTAEMMLNSTFLQNPNDAQLIGIPVHQYKTFTSSTTLATKPVSTNSNDPEDW